MSELLHDVDRREFGLVILLILITAFDTVEYEILLQRLQQVFGIGGFGRISSVGRSTFVSVLCSHSSPVCCAVCRRESFWGRWVHFDVHLRPHQAD